MTTDAVNGAGPNGLGVEVQAQVQESEVAVPAPVPQPQDMPSEASAADSTNVETSKPAAPKRTGGSRKRASVRQGSSESSMNGAHAPNAVPTHEEVFERLHIPEILHPTFRKLTVEELLGLHAMLEKGQEDAYNRGAAEAGERGFTAGAEEAGAEAYALGHATGRKEGGEAVARVMHPILVAACDWRDAEQHVDPATGKLKNTIELARVVTQLRDAVDAFRAAQGQAEAAQRQTAPKNAAPASGKP
jgi:hypothetical protein